MQRRDFMRLATGGLLAACTEPVFASAQPDFWSRPRSLWMRTVNRQNQIEEVNVVYFADGKIQQPGYDALCHLMRDQRENVTVAMSQAVLDINYAIQGYVAQQGGKRATTLDSGFRTPRTNKIVGGKDESRHLVGGATDIYVDGVSVFDLADFALRVRGGGVGVYPLNRFAHVDDGAVRLFVG